MEQLLWSAEKVAPFLKHDDRWVRIWAVERLVNVFPNEAGTYLDIVLEDPDPIIVIKAAEFYGSSKDPEYAPVLIRHLRQNNDDNFSYLAEALAELGERDALPLILDRAKQAISGERILGQSAYLHIVQALGLFGGSDSRSILKNMLDIMPGNIFAINATLGSLLHCALPEDIPEIFMKYRELPWSTLGRSVLKGFAGAINEQRLAEEMMSDPEDIDTALDEAESWTGCYVKLSELCYEELSESFDSDYKHAFDIMLLEARRLIMEQGGDVESWHAAWKQGELPSGYRRYALLVPAILEAFSESPAVNDIQRKYEAYLGFALLCVLYVQRDDERFVESAPNQVDAFFNILTDCREHVLPDIVEKVAALGPEYAPKLTSLIMSSVPDWGLVRVIRAVELMARSYPGSCDSATPYIIGLINNQGSDYLMEACSDALVAIGPSAVDEISRHLMDPDSTRQIFLAGALGNIPTQSAALALLSCVAETDIDEEICAADLMDIGSASAIEPLYEKWQSDRDNMRRGAKSQLMESLLVLCEVNGVEKPEIPEWRAGLIEQDRISEDLSKILYQELSDEEISMPSQPQRPEQEKTSYLPPKKRSVRKSKTVSKQEKKKRANQRKVNKKKK